MDAKELDVPVDENIEAEASPQASSHVAPTEMGGAMKTDEEPGEVSNVQVVCRFRPFNEREKELGLPDSKDLFRLGDGFVKVSLTPPLSFAAILGRLRDVISPSPPPLIAV